MDCVLDPRFSRSLSYAPDRDGGRALRGKKRKNGEETSSDSEDSNDKVLPPPPPPPKGPKPSRQNKGGKIQSAKK